LAIQKKRKGEISCFSYSAKRKKKKRGEGAGVIAAEKRERKGEEKLEREGSIIRRKKRKKKRGSSGARIELRGGKGGKRGAYLMLTGWRRYSGKSEKTNAGGGGKNTPGGRGNRIPWERGSRDLKKKNGEREGDHADKLYLKGKMGGLPHDLGKG